MVTAGILPHKESPHGRDGNQTRDLVISSQKLWPLDHEAGLHKISSEKLWPLDHEAGLHKISSEKLWPLDHEAGHIST
jgi:hypothetical protein